METGESWFLGDCETILLLDVFVNAPRSGLTIINGINQVLGSDGVSTDVEPVICLSPAGLIVNIDEVVSLLNLLYPVLVWQLATECLHHVVDREIVLLVGLRVLKIIGIRVLGEVFVELDSDNFFTTSIEFILNRSRIWNIINSFPTSRIKDLIICTNVLEAAAERD